ncbi:Nn.00g090610.m01.CDS01 [Neocucurbitaria sp. VM-36]
MNRVYEAAFVTIIAGAGECPKFGLAGVSARARKPQEFVDTHGHRLVCIPNVEDEVNNSTWSERGWTFQEGLLSKRRLVFTKTQTYFQCHDMHCCESTSTYLEIAHTKNLGPSKAKNKMHQVFPQKGLGMTVNDTEIPYVDLGCLERVVHILSQSYTHGRVFSIHTPSDTPGSIFTAPKIHRRTRIWHKNFSFYEPSIYLDGWVTDVRFAEHVSHAEGQLKLQSRIPYPDSQGRPCDGADDSSNLRDFLLTRPFQVLLIGNSTPCEDDEDSASSVWSNVHAIVLQPGPDNLYTRLGVVTWSKLGRPCFDDEQKLLRVKELFEARRVTHPCKCGCQAPGSAPFDRYLEDDNYVMEFRKASIQLV